MDGASKRKIGAIVISATLMTMVGASQAFADLPDNDIVAKPVGVKTEDTTVVGSRQPTVIMEFNFGGMTNVLVMCSADLGPFVSCGTPMTSNCPADECFTFQPAFATDGDHRVDGAIFDSTLPLNDPNQPLDETGYSLHIDSTLPDTELLGSAPEFDYDHETHTTIPVSFNYKTIDDDDPILYEDTAQCALTTGSAAPTAWAQCGGAQRVPLTRAVFRLWIRTVDFLGRPDPTPVESPPFSATACHAHGLNHPRTLRAMLAHPLRLQLSCLQATGYNVDLELPQRELIALNQLHRDIASAYVAQLSGHTAGEHQRAVVTLKLLRRIPKDLLDAPHLRLDVRVSGGPAPFLLHNVTAQ